MRLVACMSQNVQPAECNYPAHEREMLALVVALKYWRSYLWGAQIKAYTDSTFVHCLKTCELNSPRQVRWVSLIETYNVEFTHIQGTTNTAADALSRLKGSLMPVLPMDPVEDWGSLYMTNNTPIAGLTPWKADTERTNTYFHHGEWWLYDIVMVPDAKIDEVITNCHDAITAGHWDSQKTLQIL